MAKLVANTYGEALFSLAVEENKVDALYEEALSLSDILKENPDFDTLMNHPKVTSEEKEKVLEEVFDGRISRELEGFLKLLLANDRYKDLDKVLEFFFGRVKEYKGIGIAWVSSALPLSDAQKAAVEKKLLETAKYKKMEMHYETDESLIGGMVIRIGDRVVNSSISYKLDSLKRSLLDSQAV